MSSKSDASIIARRLAKRGYLTLAHHVAEKCHVTVEEMLGRSKRKSHAVARHMLWFAIYADGHLSFPEMAVLFERDHSTIYSGVVKQGALPVAKTIADDDNASESSECA